MPSKFHLKPLADRFFAKVEKTPTCWIWKASVEAGGYGHIGIGRRGEGMKRCHRVSWELHIGPVPANLCVLHRCDNRRCVNPEHLFLGTKKDNSRDMAAKGRQVFQLNPERVARGERQGSAKLTEEQAREIKNSDLRQYEVAKKYGVSLSTVNRLRCGRTWAHIK